MNPVSNVLRDPCLERVIGRFPYWKSLIEREYARSESFRSLCDDWLVCLDTFQRWRSVEGSLAQSLGSEYLALMAELEREIVFWLDSPAKTEVPSATRNCDTAGESLDGNMDSGTGD